jgi:hypothetical protein
MDIPRETELGDADHLPGNFRRSFELGARVIGSLGDGADLQQEIAKRREALREVLDPHDAVHLMGQLCMAESFIDPDTYAESEHPGSAYVIEVVAAELLRRDDRAGSRNASSIDANPSHRLASRGSAHLTSPGPSKPLYTGSTRMNFRLPQKIERGTPRSYHFQFLHPMAQSLPAA